MSSGVTGGCQQLAKDISGLPFTWHWQELVDIINEQKLLKVMDAIIDKDAGRTIRLLLANTALAVQIDNITGKPFDETIGTPQGDLLGADNILGLRK